jgi:hypothetical protein
MESQWFEVNGRQLLIKLNPAEEILFETSGSEFFVVGAKKNVVLKYEKLACEQYKHKGARRYNQTHLRQPLRFVLLFFLSFFLSFTVQRNTVFEVRKLAAAALFSQQKITLQVRFATLSKMDKKIGKCPSSQNRLSSDRLGLDRLRSDRIGLAPLGSQARDNGHM